VWLIQNYEAAKGMALAFSTVYKHYLHHCKENKLNPVNQSLFGKLFRSVFLGLKTRRFGTRCNTKYYYYGIRVIPGSELNNLSEDEKSAVGQQASSEKSNKILPVSDTSGSGTHKTENQYGQNIYYSTSCDHSYSLSEYPNDHQFQSEALPVFPEIGFPLPEDFIFGV
jgi:regulatory factor X 1/2/3